MRWPEGPPHLALSPPYFVVCFVCFVFSFPFFALIEKTCFPLESAFSVFECLPLFLLCLFGLPLFQFFFFSLSIYLTYFSFFFPSCISVLFCFGLLLLSLS